VYIYYTNSTRLLPIQSAQPKAASCRSTAAQAASRSRRVPGWQAVAATGGGEAAKYI